MDQVVQLILEHLEADSEHQANIIKSYCENKDLVMVDDGSFNYLNEDNHLLQCWGCDIFYLQDYFTFKCKSCKYKICNDCALKCVLCESDKAYCKDDVFKIKNVNLCKFHRDRLQEYELLNPNLTFL